METSRYETKVARHLPFRLLCPLSPFLAGKKKNLYLSLILTIHLTQRYPPFDTLIYLYRRRANNLKHSYFTFSLDFSSHFPPLSKMMGPGGTPIGLANVSTAVTSRPERHAHFSHEYESPKRSKSPEEANRARSREKSALSTNAYFVPPQIENSAPSRPKMMMLERGLQIPSRRSTITSGFKLPPLLQEHRVTVEQWDLFTRELRGHARMTGSQFLTFVGYSIGFGLVWNFFPVFGVIPSTIMSHKLAKRMEHQNFNTAQTSGALETFSKRWNENYFERLGLRVDVEVPGNGNMDGMDVASTKLFRYQQKFGTTSPLAGAASKYATAREARYQSKEGHQRVKAAHKARIIFVPLRKTRSENLAPQETGLVDNSDSPNGDGGGSPESIQSNRTADSGFWTARRLSAERDATLPLVH